MNTLENINDIDHFLIFTVFLQNINTLENPFKTENSKNIKTPIIQMGLVLDSGEELQVKNASAPFIFEMMVTEENQPSFVTFYPENMTDTGLLINIITIESEHHALYAVVIPEDNTREFAVYVKKKIEGQTLKINESDFNFDLPHEISENINTESLSQKQIDEYRYNIFLTPEDLSPFGPGNYFLVLKQKGISKDNNVFFCIVF